MKYRCCILADLLAAPALCGAAIWSKSFAVEWYEPAFHHGAKDSADGPGTDCPAGTNPENDWRKLLKTSYRTDADIEKILDPENPQRAASAASAAPTRRTCTSSRGWCRIHTWSVSAARSRTASTSTATPGRAFAACRGERGIDNSLYLVSGFVIEPDGRTLVRTAKLYPGDIDPSIGRRAVAAGARTQ